MGNICRSPMVEAVARVELARAGIDAHVASAGTERYHVGQGADPRAVALAEANGYPLAAHRARQVQADDFERFDFILAMDRVNLADIKRHRPKSASRDAALFLSEVGYADADEVPDPYYGTRKDFERVLALARDGSALLIDHLKRGREAKRA